MNNTIIKKILFAAGIVAVIIMAFDTKAKNSWLDDADNRKADYLYMEAQRQNALGNSDAYFELIRRAYMLDSADTDLGFSLGYFNLALAGEDSTMFAKGYNLIRRHFQAQPSDLYSSYFYGNLNNRLGIRNEALRVWRTLDSIYPEKMEMAMKYAEALSASTDTADLLKSIEITNRIERAEGKMIHLSSNKIRCLLEMGDTAKINAELQQLLASSPSSSEYNVFAAEVYSILGRNDSALHSFNRACDLDSANGLAFFLRANFFKQLGDSASYDREVFHSLKLETLDLDAKLQLLTGYIRELYTDSTQHQRIENLFDVLIEQHPHEPDIHDLYCSYLIAINDFLRAAEQASIVVDMEPANEDRWRALISLYMQAEDYPQAIDAGQRALRYHPASSMIVFLEGNCFHMNKDYDKAIMAYNHALHLNDSADFETNSSIISSIGDVYAQLEQTDSAYLYYEKALKLNPENLLTLNNYAYYLSVEGRDLDRAEAMSAITIEKEPENDNSLDTYAWIMFKKKDYVRAKEYIDRAIECSDGNSAELWEHAGDIYFMNGEPEQAVEFWKKAIKLNPDSELLQRKVQHRTYFYK